MWSKRNRSHGNLQKADSNLSIQDVKCSRPKANGHMWSERDEWNDDEARYCYDVRNRPVN